MFFLIDNTENNVIKYNNFILYKNEKNIFLPRYIDKYIKGTYYFYNDKNFIPKEITKYNFTSTLFYDQKILMDEIINIYYKNNYINGVFHLRCGIGKTVCAIYIASILNKKTLIVIDMGKIINQWKEQILLHSDLKESDIGIIKGKVFDVEDKKVIITTPQTLAAKIKKDINSFYKKFRDIGIDLVFYDEAHQLGQKYASSTLLFNTKNIIGLTATPYFNGKKEILFRSIFGETLIKSNKYDYIPKIEFVKFNSGLGGRYGKRVLYLWNNGWKSFINAKTIYNSKLIESETWLNNIVNIVKNNKENRIIILCNFITQLETICERLNKEGITFVKLYSKENTIDKEKDNVIVAIEKFASKAFDYKELNRIILTFPILGKKLLIQSIGRVIRKCEGKEDVIVYDLIDTDAGFGGIFINSIKNKINILKQEYNECEFING